MLLKSFTKNDLTFHHRFVVSEFQEIKYQVWNQISILRQIHISWCHITHVASAVANVRKRLLLASPVLCVLADNRRALLISDRYAYHLFLVTRFLGFSEYAFIATDGPRFLPPECTRFFIVVVYDICVSLGVFTVIVIDDVTRSCIFARDLSAPRNSASRSHVSCRFYRHRSHATNFSQLSLNVIRASIIFVAANIRECPSSASSPLFLVVATVIVCCLFFCRLFQCQQSSILVI